MIQTKHYNTDIFNEKDWDTDLEEEEPSSEEIHSPKNVYKKMCENLKVIPCRYFMTHIDKQKLVMKYHQFSNDEIRAVSKPLWVNFFTFTVNIRKIDSCIGNKNV